MSFDYDRSSQGHNGDSFWTSYSDLFLGLSTIFLLLYVTASLRTGTDAIKNQVDNQKLTMQNEELKNQLKMYETVKTQYLEKEASKSEQQEYTELMDKLTLLREDAKNDKDRLATEALENETKERALNKYQQLVRNIINANKLAKTKLIARNDIIDDQDSTIDEQKQDINGLQTDVDTKKAELEENERKIAETKHALEKSKKQLRSAFNANEISKKEFQEKTRKLEAQNDKKVRDLKNANQAYSAQLNDLSGKLKGTQSALAAKSQEANGLQDKIGKIKGDYEKEQAGLKAAFDAEVKKGQMNAAEQARREGEFKAAASAKEKEMQGKLAGLSGRLKDTEGALAKAKEEMDARRAIAKEIQKGFAAAGVKADVDSGTGEVVLDFGNTYFDSDSAKLKPRMKEVIEKAMPIYSKSLFGNPKVASKISSVEIVGFASPTYNGRFIDPKSSKAADREALKYNMDLSYRRANSIFGYLLESKESDGDQKNLLSLMKVSGRSFLDVMKVKSRGPASAAEFCKVNDCKKAQRVIVRFSMDGKGGADDGGKK
jgi:outer membrane protein OmpA-like peptidoglycan-associated protein